MRWQHATDTGRTARIGHASLERSPPSRDPRPCTRATAALYPCHICTGTGLKPCCHLIARPEMRKGVSLGSALHACAGAPYPLCRPCVPQCVCLAAQWKLGAIGCCDWTDRACECADGLPELLGNRSEFRVCAPRRGRRPPRAAVGEQAPLPSARARRATVRACVLLRMHMRISMAHRPSARCPPVRTGLEWNRLWWFALWLLPRQLPQRTTYVVPYATSLVLRSGFDASSAASETFASNSTSLCALVANRPSRRTRSASSLLAA